LPILTLLERAIQGGLVVVRPFSFFGDTTLPMLDEHKCKIVVKPIKKLLDIIIFKLNDSKALLFIVVD
jgi:hypothetical protein